MKILLIEDDIPIRDVVKRGLEENKLYSVDTASDGEIGLQMALDNEYSAVILDIMLPKLDGWTVCKELRSHRINTPVLMLTARDAVKDRVYGLEIGADDYLPKPFDFEELLARIKALIRRDMALKTQFIEIDGLKIDMTSQQVFDNGTEIFLSHREFALLEALARNEGRILSREAIQNRIWNSDDSFSNTVDVYISALRKKIDTNRNVKLIHTIYGTGYMLKKPELED